MLAGEDSSRTIEIDMGVAGVVPPETPDVDVARMPDDSALQQPDDDEGKKPDGSVIQQPVNDDEVEKPDDEGKKPGDSVVQQPGNDDEVEKPDDEGKKPDNSAVSPPSGSGESLICRSFVDFCFFFQLRRMSLFVFCERGKRPLGCPHYQKIVCPTELVSFCWVVSSTIISFSAQAAKRRQKRQAELEKANLKSRQGCVYFCFLSFCHYAVNYIVFRILNEQENRQVGGHEGLSKQEG